MQNDSAFRCTLCGTTQYTTELASQICVSCAKSPKAEPVPGFNEIFAKFDAWYWDKYRHHPEKMVVEQFYKFLNREAD